VEEREEEERGKGGEGGRGGGCLFQVTVGSYRGRKNP